MNPRPYNSRSREAAAEETRKRIVHATVALHAENGVLGTSHEMIARRADVSLPTVYKYFPTRNDLVPHCTGLVMGEAPVQLDAAIFGTKADVQSRLRLLARRIFAFHEYAAPWMRWSARDATELPALQAMLNEAASARAMLIREALSPTFDRHPPRRLVSLSSVLLDFPSWQTLVESGLTSKGAASAVGEALVSLYSTTQKEKQR